MRMLLPGADKENFASRCGPREFRFPASNRIMLLPSAEQENVASRCRTGECFFPVAGTMMSVAGTEHKNFGSRCRQGQFCFPVRSARISLPGVQPDNVASQCRTGECCFPVAGTMILVTKVLCVDIDNIILAIVYSASKMWPTRSGEQHARTNIQDSSYGKQYFSARSSQPILGWDYSITKPWE